MAKIQDGNGSSQEEVFRDNSKKPQPTRTDITKNKPFDPECEEINQHPPEGDPEDPESVSRGIDRLEKFQDDENLPYDTNAANVKQLMNEYLAKLSKGLRI